MKAVGVGLALVLVVLCALVVTQTSAPPVPPPAVHAIDYVLPTATPGPVPPAADLVRGVTAPNEPTAISVDVPEQPPEGATAASLSPVIPLNADPTKSLTSEEVDAVYERVGVPAEWRADLKAIAVCESGLGTPYVHPGVVGDGGSSLGGHQLWRGWFREGEDPMDFDTNTRVAVRVRLARGRYGGAGGWSCADRLGIP